MTFTLSPCQQEAVDTVEVEFDPASTTIDQV